MNKAKLLLTALFLTLAVVVSAQTVTVTGTISEASTGEAVPFASVMVKGTMTGTSSDVNGVYSINAPANAVLVFTAVGYVEVEVPVNSRGKIDVKMDVDALALENAVVVGYGTAKKVSSLVGSVQTVSSETIRNAPSSSALDQLQGQVAGLSVLSYSGVAGDDAVSMTLHGVGSISSDTTPLYVVDGVPTTSRSIMAMNPNDIESISVLKDAAATSIYGSRAANGVIYVTTKSGSYNEKATVTVRSQWGVSTLASMNLYKNMMSGDELMDFWVRAGIWSADYIQSTYIDNGYTYNTKWYEYFMNVVTPQSQNDITIEGGGRKVAYMISASQYSQEGFTIGNYYDRYTMRTNVQARPVDWLKVGMNANFSYDITEQNPNWGSASQGMSNYTSGGLSYLLNPLYPAVDENGNVYEEYFDGLGTYNPNYYMYARNDVYKRYGLNGSTYIEIEPVRNLKITSRAGIDGYIRNRDATILPSVAEKYTAFTAQVLKANYLSYSATITNTIEYSMDINPNNSFSVLVGHEGIANDYSYFYASSTGQTDDNYLTLDNGLQSSYAMAESSTQSRFLSFFGHADYTLFNRYIFDATVRNDASSRFGSAVRNATFWSAGFRWNVKRENFMRNAAWVNSLDFKVSYGTQGNAEIGDYEHLGLITSSGTYNQVSGLAVEQPANSMLTWEQQGLLTVAASGRFFNRLDLNLEFYDRRTTSMLMDVPNPYTTGFSETTQNVGTLQNTGIDINLGVDILQGRDYYLRFSTVFNYNNQKILELFDGRERWEISGTYVAYVVGSPIMFYMPIYAGVDPEDGAPMWYVPGDDIDVTTTTETTKVFDEDALMQNTGVKRYAPINGGFSISGGWKGLSIRADFSYVLGKYLISNDAYFYANPANFSTMNTHKMVSDFWTPDNTDAAWPDWSQGYVMQFDTHLLENASFLRLKNLQIGYSLPERLLNWSNGVLKGVKVTVTGRNLLTFTKYSGIDPEINSNLTYGMTGNSRQVLGGLEITF